MPGEWIRSLAADTAAAASDDVPITVRGRTVRIHLAGILDRAAADAMIRSAAAVLATGRYQVVLDAGRLLHLDYRCVPVLVRWNRVLATRGHRLMLDRWNDYLLAILAMEDWDGELQKGGTSPVPSRRWSRPAPVQAP